MKNSDICFEAREMYVEGHAVMAQLIPLAVGETIEGKREQFLAQGYSIGGLGVIADFLIDNPALQSREYVVIADASDEPIIPKGNPIICQVQAHGICKGCPGAYVWDGLIDYRVPKHKDDPTILAILVILS